MKSYKGYRANVSFDEDAMIFHGEVIGIRDVITFQATTAQELSLAFHESVDDYLAFCLEDGVEPNKPFSGKLAFRTSPERHRMITEAAAASALSINQWMDDTLESAARQVLEDGQRKIRLV